MLRVSLHSYLLECFPYTLRGTFGSEEGKPAADGSAGGGGQSLLTSP